MSPEGVEVVHQASEKGIPPQFRGLKVIDTDTHWTEPPDFWSNNAPAKYKDRIPTVRKVNGEDHWIIEGDTDWGSIGATVVGRDGKKIAGVMSYTSFEEASPAASVIKDRLELMDQEGIAYQILYPNSVGFQANRFMQLGDVTFRLEMLKLYNTNIAEVQADSGGRLLPQILVPSWDMDATVQELQRCKDLDFCGVTIGDKPELLGLPDYAQPYWHPFWDFMNESGLVANFHIGGSSALDAFAVPWKSFGFQRNTAIAATIFYMSNAGTLANLVFSGLFDRYDKLKLASVESGVGWIPFVLDALEYQKREMIPTEMKHVKLGPTEYFHKHIYACTWFEEQSLKAAVDVLGADNIMYMSDFPHPTCVYPDALSHVENAGLSEEVNRKILQDNAARVYGIKI